VGTEIFFGKSEIRLDSPVNKLPDGQISNPIRPTRGAEIPGFLVVQQGGPSGNLRAKADITWRRQDFSS
jgi:hypothetical protein